MMLMSVNPKNDDQDLVQLTEALGSVENNELSIADHEREIARLRKRKGENEKKACIIAVNVFTEEKIKSIHKKANKYRLTDFDEEEFIRVFSNEAHVTINHISFLLELLSEINTAELLEVQKNEKSKSSFWTKLADSFMRGGAKND